MLQFLDHAKEPPHLSFSFVCFCFSLCAHLISPRQLFQMVKTWLPIAPGLGITEHLFVLFSFWSQVKKSRESSEHLCLSWMAPHMPITRVIKTQPTCVTCCPSPPQPRRSGLCLKMAFQFEPAGCSQDDHFEQDKHHLTSLLRSLPARNFLLYLSVECFTGISDSASFPHTIPKPDSPQYMALPYVQLFKEDTLELSLTLSSLSLAPYFLYFLSQTLYFALFLAAITLFQPILS